MSQRDLRLREVRNQARDGHRPTAGCWGGTAATKAAPAVEVEPAEPRAGAGFDELLELDWSCGAESAPARLAQAAAARQGATAGVYARLYSAATAPADWEAPRTLDPARTDPPALPSRNPRATRTLNRDTTIIRGKGLNKRYVMSEDNYVDAVKDASVEIRQGEMVAVMGPSGSGKSTLVHVLSCLDSADSGEIWLGGRRVDNLSRRDLAKLRRAEVGFIFQTFNLVTSFTALENVMLAAEYAGKSRREARRAAQEALIQVGLGDRMGHRPTELSGGQQQRVAIAGALVNSPKVIFGDEPTGNLDSASSAEIVQTMSDINEQTGTTFVLVTHDFNVASTCDRVFHMLDGRVTNAGGEKSPARLGRLGRRGVRSAGRPPSGAPRSDVHLPNRGGGPSPAAPALILPLVLPGHRPLP